VFSGIVEEIGTIKKITPSGGVNVYEIAAKQIFGDLKEGDSVSVNGVCLTAEKIKGTIFTASLSKQTLKETNLSNIGTGGYVNIERAMRLGDRIGGHILSGHIDFKTPLRYLYKEQNNGILGFSMPAKFQRYVVQRGSIGVDGISFTIAELNGREVKISVIPYTMEHTNIKYRRQGDMLNIEVDINAKHIERLIEGQKRYG